jgi:hypothetical protein
MNENVEEVILHLLHIGTKTPSVVNGVYQTFYVIFFLLRCTLKRRLE